MLFDGPAPRLFGLPPGVDFAKELIFGLEQRLNGQPPEALARVEVFVNTARMRRRLVTLFNRGPARLLPRIRLVTELGDIAGLPAAVSPLRRRLELSQLVAKLLDQQPDLGARASLFDLSDSLADLMDEMHSEGVAPDALRDLDLAHLSAHWARTQSFLEIVTRFFDSDSDGGLDAGARTRLAAEALARRWEAAPPEHPIIVAGSTGSRGATALFMEAVAKLPQGAVVLPGFDTQPASVWSALDGAIAAEDHPQYRFRALTDALNITPADVRPWHDAARSPNPSRNRLISLALRPAPVTDQWMVEGPKLEDLAQACAEVTLIEAPSPRAEALSIALRLRRAAEEGTTAALITPDRMLTRQVTAALDRWGIEPDDSAGQPLPLSPPGRLFRHIAALFGARLTAEALLALLKHPLVASPEGVRGNHLRWTHELELHIRSHGLPFPTGDDIVQWAAKKNGSAAWAEWLAHLLRDLPSIGIRPLTEHVAHHIALAEAFTAGPEAEDYSALWAEKAGVETKRALDALTHAAPYGGAMSPGDYAELFRGILNKFEVRNPIRPHPDIMIWGTLEARVQGADLVILGGLNEGSWPEMPPPDPWLNREMRRKTGMLSPERRIGLSAHDFQQAIAAKEVVLSRAIRDAEAETVPSRWLNRLLNLLNGLGAHGGKTALQNMQARGAELLALAEALEAPEQRSSPAPRPAPCPPVCARPNGLFVTRIQTLIRDPYSIYARYILNLKKLESLRPEPNPAMRGTALHKVLEGFIRAGVNPDPAQAKADLMSCADLVFEEAVPWPAARRIWRARLGRVADWLIAGEYERQAEGSCVLLEETGSVALPNGFVLGAKADRIDQRSDGTLIVYDYKTGKPPTPAQMQEYDKQLLLQAAMAERGAFEDVAPSKVHHAAYIGLGSEPKFQKTMLEDGLAETTWLGLIALIDKYRQRSRGYLARRTIFKHEDVTDYDHLSRYGEWSESDPAKPQEVGE